MSQRLSSPAQTALDARAERLTEEHSHLQAWLARRYHGEMKWMERDPAQRTDPRQFFPPARSVIVVALNYYTDLDLAVSSLNTMALPAADADQIRARWFKPAQRSLEAFRSNLETIRKASVDGDSGLVDQQLALLQHVGSQGVDAQYLKSLGVSRCLPLFGTPT